MIISRLTEKFLRESSLCCREHKPPGLLLRPSDWRWRRPARGVWCTPRVREQEGVWWCTEAPLVCLCRLWLTEHQWWEPLDPHGRHSQASQRRRCFLRSKTKWLLEKGNMDPGVCPRRNFTFLQIFDWDVKVLQGWSILSVKQVENKEVLCVFSMQACVFVAQQVHIHHLLGAVCARCQSHPALTFLRQNRNTAKTLHYRGRSKDVSHPVCILIHINTSSWSSILLFNTSELLYDNHWWLSFIFYSTLPTFSCSNPWAGTLSNTNSTSEAVVSLSSVNRTTLDMSRTSPGSTSRPLFLSDSRRTKFSQYSETT